MMVSSPTEVKSRSIRGLNTSFFFLGLTALLTLGRKVVLARLLLPSDFGLFAFATVVIVFATNLSSLHMEDVIVQTRTDSRKMLNTAFTSQLAISVPAFVLVAFFSGLISRGLGKPEMTAYLRAGSIVLLLVPLSLPRALFLRSLDIFRVKLPMALGMLANASICIAMAAAGLGIWSLVAGYVLDALVSALVIWICCEKRPRLEFDRVVFREILYFSLPLYLLTFMAWVFWQGDDFIVGILGDRTLSLSGNAALGFYTLAFYFPHQLERVRVELAGVSYPAFSLVRDDPERLGSAYEAVTKSMAILVLSFGAVLIPLARPTVLYLLGEKWLLSVRPLQVFFLVVILRSITANWGEVYRSLGRTRALIWSFIPNPVLLLLLGPYVTRRFGILGMSILIMCIIPLTQPLVIYLTKKALPGVSFSKLLFKPCLVFGIVLIIAWALSGLVETRTCYFSAAAGLFALYYLLLSAIDSKFRISAGEYLRISLFRR